MAYPLLTGKREQGVNPGGSPGGPREGNRMRNTMANLLSKTTAPPAGFGTAAMLPPMSPESTANYYGQLAGLEAQFALTRKAERARRVGLQADFSAARAGIVLGRKQGIRDVEYESRERGLTGSSIQATGVADVRAEARGQLSAARSEQIAGREQSLLAVQQAGIERYMGGLQLEAQKAAEQQSGLAAALANNTIMSGMEPQLSMMEAMFQAQMVGLKGLPTAASARSKRKLPNLFLTAAREGGGY